MSPCVIYGSVSRSKQGAHLLCRATGNNHFRRPQQTVLKSVTAPGLAHHNFFGKLITRLMSDCFVHVRVERFPLSLDRLESIFSEQIAKLFLEETPSVITGEVRALFLCCREAKLKIVNNSHQALQQRA